MRGLVGAVFVIYEGADSRRQAFRDKEFLRFCQGVKNGNFFSDHQGSLLVRMEGKGLVDQILLHDQPRPPVLH